MLNREKKVGGGISGFRDQYFLNLVATRNLVNHIDAFNHLAKAGVFAVEVSGLCTAQADEELAATCVTACMCHTQHTAVMELVAAIEFAIDGVSGTTAAGALGAATLDHKTRDHAMKGEAIIETLTGQFHKIGNCAGCVSFVEVNFHVTLLGTDFCCEHEIIFAVKIRRGNGK